MRVLETEGPRVRCLARRPDYLQERVSDAIEVVRGDLLDRDFLFAAMGDIATASYLGHSLGSAGDFANEERQCAQNFTHAASQAGVSRIIYLGGLAADAPNLSDHLRSPRAAVGSGCPGGGRAGVDPGHWSVSREAEDDANTAPSGLTAVIGQAAVALAWTLGRDPEWSPATWR